MAFFEFGGQFAWLAVALSICLFVPLILAASIPLLSILVRPLAVAGLGVSGYTIANGVAYLLRWDAGTTYAKVLATTTLRSQGEILAVMLVPVWPYIAVAFGAIVALLYVLILWRTAAFIHSLSNESRGDGGRRARERAGNMRWER